MPELPEVETIRAQLEPILSGATIADAWTFGTQKFAQATEVVGLSIIDIRRRGKYLIIGLSSCARFADGSDTPEIGGAYGTPDIADIPDIEMIIHLGMTGRLSVAPPNESTGESVDFGSDFGGADFGGADFGARVRHPHRRADWLLSDDRIIEFTDTRRFGRIAVVEPGQYSSLATLAHLGPEPFDDEFTPEFLRARLHQSTQAIKTQLMSQRVVAGLGNIYVDEALWAARVNPRSTRVTKAQSVALHDSIVSSLEAGIRNGGTTLRDYRDATGASGNNQLTLKCYGRSGLPCLHCGGTLARTVISGRSTTFCPLCQRRK